MSKLVYIHFRLKSSMFPFGGLVPTFFELRSKTDAFKKKLTLWDSRVEKDEMFPNLQELCITNLHKVIS